MGKKSTEEPKLEELSNDELSEVQGGAVLRSTRSATKKLTTDGTVEASLSEWKVSEMDGKSNN